MKKIILASKSPRRIELMECLNIPFEIHSADVDETINPDLKIETEIMRLAQQKAQAVLDFHPDSVVIGADTLVVHNNQALGKPIDRQNAKDMLKTLSGTTHQVITGVCLLSNNQCETFYHSSDVVVYELSEKEIDDYIDTNEPMDKAGSYAIQGLGRLFVKEIHGDFFSIMGFPVSIIHRKLNDFLNSESVQNKS